MSTRLFLSIFQGKPGEALDVLRGPLGAAISLPSEQQEAEAALLEAKGDATAAAALYAAALKDNPDDWVNVVRYLDCTMSLTGGGSNSSSGSSSGGGSCSSRAFSASCVAVAKLIKGEIGSLEGGMGGLQVAGGYERLGWGGREAEDGEGGGGGGRGLEGAMGGLHVTGGYEGEGAERVLKMDMGGLQVAGGDGKRCRDGKRGGGGRGEGMWRQRLGEGTTSHCE